MTDNTGKLKSSGLALAGLVAVAVITAMGLPRLRAYLVGPPIEVLADGCDYTPYTEATHFPAKEGAAFQTYFRPVMAPDGSPKCTRRRNESANLTDRTGP